MMSHADINRTRITALALWPEEFKRRESGTGECRIRYYKEAWEAAELFSLRAASTLQSYSFPMLLGLAPF